ncbi:MAG TPA: hypothetical protein VHC39_13290 [Rhizomicrobium sp.]|nr:hypothetical protein [Rhizomicrobium sp.]
MDTPDEWIEMAWAARDAAAPARNAARRRRFEAVKGAIGESDLPPSLTNSNANLMRFKSR